MSIKGIIKLCSVDIIAYLCIFVNYLKLIKEKNKKDIRYECPLKGGEIMNKENVLLECQKEFLLNSRYESTEWNANEKTFMHTCNKGRIHICYDISDDSYSHLNIDDVIDIHKKMSNEMVNVCQKCKYYN